MRASLFLVITAALGCAGISLPAGAQTTEQDVRCLLASNVFAATEKDATKKQVATASALFYLGRLDARMTLPQLKAQILAQGKTLTGKTVGDVMNVCARELQAKQRAVQAMGQEIAKSQKK
jgi:hypothetical protein